MPRRHRSHSTEFKRQVVAEYHAGETLHALSRRHDLSRSLVHVWVEKAEAGAFYEDEAAAELLSAYETRIAALERLVGRQALDIEFLKGAVRSSIRKLCALTRPLNFLLRALAASSFLRMRKKPVTHCSVASRHSCIAQQFWNWGFKVWGTILPFDLLARVAGICLLGPWGTSLKRFPVPRCLLA